MEDKERRREGGGKTHECKPSRLRKKNCRIINDEEAYQSNCGERKRRIEGREKKRDSNVIIEKTVKRRTIEEGQKYEEIIGER